MKFSSYLLRLNYKETAFTGNLEINGKLLSANFKRVNNDYFTVNLKEEVSLSFGEKLLLKRGDKYSEVLLPLFSKYNKKKLSKVVKLLSKEGEIKKEDILLIFLNLEKVFEAEKIREFLSLTSDEITGILLSMEIDKKVKIIGFHNLLITSFDVFLDSSKLLEETLIEYYSKRKQKVNIAELGKKIRLTENPLLLRYLLIKIKEEHDFKLVKNMVIFKKLPLTAKESDVVKEVEKIIKKNRLGIFSIDSIAKVSGLRTDEINDSLWHLLSEEKIIQMDDKKENFIFTEELGKIVNRLKKFKRNQGDTIDIVSFREITVFNRKNIIILMEYLDSEKITTRNGNKRIIELNV
ncbi:MAG: SelB C-terminal domain-containing protein [Acidobacteriota bacterium]